MNSITHRAKWVLISPEQIIENGFVTVSGGRIVASGRGRGPKGTRKKDHGPGMLMPALVNAHTHLDLTALDGAPLPDSDFLSWVRGVITGKAALTKEEILAGILKGQEFLWQSGCILAGDHRSFSLETPFSENPFIHVFHEYLGTKFPPIVPASNGASSSLAAHAPHTTAPRLILDLKQRCRQKNLVFSMHVAESPEEMEFITTAGGTWAEFLESRGISFEMWGLPAPSPIRHLDHLGVLDSRTLAIHLVQTDRDDLKILARKGVRVCVCPRSNRNLLDQLPDVHAMVDWGLRPALGTDSLASVSSLDLFDEMRFLVREVPDLSPADIIAMGTVNGARALDREKELGTLEPGKRAVMLFLPVDGANSEAAIAKLLSGDFQVSPEWVL
ncbi:MAG: amidohydrolase family protein [Deltaproteobacteria bacterium]|nr:amidohydrolase family protein [Deltaproteobacteria bacterium]